MKGFLSPVWLSLIGVLLLLNLISMLLANFTSAAAPKIREYKVIEVRADTQSMQEALDRYAADGWELSTIGMGDLTPPRLIFTR